MAIWNTEYETESGEVIHIYVDYLGNTDMPGGITPLYQAHAKGLKQLGTSPIEASRNWINAYKTYQHNMRAANQLCKQIYPLTQAEYERLEA